MMDQQRQKILVPQLGVQMPRVGTKTEVKIPIPSPRPKMTLIIKEEEDQIEQLKILVKKIETRINNLQIQAIVNSEENVDDEEISTIGKSVMTKERGNKLSDDMIKTLLNRLAKNITTYQHKYLAEKQLQIINMKENQRILREIREERKYCKK